MDLKRAKIVLPLLSFGYNRLIQRFGLACKCVVMASGDLAELRFVYLAVFDPISVQEVGCLFRDHGRYKPENHIAVPVSC